jgi:hypothetical protein
MKMYKLLESDGMGYFDTHTDWLTKEEADEMRARYARLFPHQDWIIEPHEDDDADSRGVFRNTPNHACDGWEDFFPNRD